MGEKKPPLVIEHEGGDVSIDFPYPVYLSMGKAHTHLILDTEEYRLLKNAMKEGPKHES